MNNLGTLLLGSAAGIAALGIGKGLYDTYKFGESINTPQTQDDEIGTEQVRYRDVQKQDLKLIYIGIGLAGLGGILRERRAR